MNVTGGSLSHLESDLCECLKRGDLSGLFFQFCFPFARGLPSVGVPKAVSERGSFREQRAPSFHRPQ